MFPLSVLPSSTSATSNPTWVPELEASTMWQSWETWPSSGWRETWWCSGVCFKAKKQATKFIQTSFHSRDLTHHEFIEALKIVATQMKVGDYKIFMCIIMTHGDANENLFCSDEIPLTVNAVLEKFIDVQGIPKVLKIRHFSQKAKQTLYLFHFQIFLFNSCRGLKENQIQHDNPGLDSLFRDTFLWFGCEKDHTLFRDITAGSPFIKEFSKVRTVQFV